MTPSRYGSAGLNGPGIRSSTWYPLRCIRAPERAEFAEAKYRTWRPYRWGTEDRWWVVRASRGPLTVAAIETNRQPIAASEAHSSVIPVVADAMDRIERFRLADWAELTRFVAPNPA
jgi:hypothetical protein